MAVCFFWICLLIVSHFLLGTEGCGGSTHIEISHRAQDLFNATYSDSDYGSLILKHPDAMEAGSPYPDAYYDTLCFKGQYHDISEDTHWTPFLNATVNYIRKHYPMPWDEATEKLVVFLLGTVSHQVADISWHGLGIDQGFLDAMGAINFHNSFDNAHSVGDPGGDILNMFELNLDYMPYLQEWYVPVDDLYNIYTELYGTPRLPRNAIVDCTLELYAERFGEKLAIGKLYADYAAKSPFMVDQLTDYYLGGLDDMAVWTQNIWQRTIFMLETGTQSCNLDHNPLFITCNGQDWPMVQKSGKRTERNGFYKKRMYTNVTKDDFVIRKSLRGVTLKPQTYLQKALIFQKTQQRFGFKEPQKSQATVQKGPDAIFYLNNTYAKLGWSLAVRDLDGDGNDDAVIGAPGYRLRSSPQCGAVFVLFGTDKGLPLTEQNLEQSADVILYGKDYTNGRLGSAVTVVDVNQDGILDIAAGAPSSNSSMLSYTGSVEVYFGTGHRVFVHNMTILCQAHYCNLGRSLATADVNSDGFDDLLIGSPFSGSKGDQRGFVTALLSSRKYQGIRISLDVSQLQWAEYGLRDYSWFGQNVYSTRHPLSNETLVLVTEPALRLCFMPDCSYHPNDTQSAGRINVYSSVQGKPLMLNLTVTGTDNFQSFGSSAAVGQPFVDETPILAVGATGQNVAGSVLGLPMTFPLTGAVYLFNLSDLHQKPIAVFSSDRRHSRFGMQILFSDINDDGYDDLIIGAPLRTKDITEEIHAGEEGAAYIYFGGETFPKGPNPTSICRDPSFVTPCPADIASVELVFNEDRARFGYQFAIVRSKTKVQLLVTAIHSSHGARLSGAVTVFNLVDR